MAVNGPVSVADRDRELVDRLAARDERALREIYATYGRRLLAYAARVTGTVERAEEVVQDSILAAWAKPRSYRGDGSVLSWLLGIVRRRALSAVRRRQPAIADLDVAREIGSPEATPQAECEARERALVLRQALARLSPDHREVLDLVFYQGLDLAEVAAVCRCPVGTVKSRLHYAKTRLRSVLVEQGMETSE